jgi:hypothetical protein
MWNGCGIVVGSLQHPVLQSVDGHALVDDWLGSVAASPGPVLVGW